MPPDTRFPGKLGEELSDPNPEDHKPGTDYRCTFVPGATISGTTVFTSPGSPGVPGDVPIGRHAFGQTLGTWYQDASVFSHYNFSSDHTKVDRSQETFTHSSVQGLSNQPILVAGSQQTFSGDESRNTTETHSCHRCLSYGLGSSPARLYGSGDIGTIRIPTQHQLARAKSHQIGSDALCANFDTNTCLDPDGQYDGQGILASYLMGKATLLFQRVEVHLLSLKAVHLAGKANVTAGWLSRQTYNDSETNSSRGVQGPDLKVGVSSHGSLCIKIQCPISEISDLIPNKRGRGDRCPTVPLAGRFSIRLPSNPIFFP